MNNLSSHSGYIKSKAFTDIQAKNTIVSVFWKFFLSAHEDVQNCMDYWVGYITRWRAGKPLNNLGAISEKIRKRSQKVLIDEGMQSHMPTKFSVISWRIKWKYLPTFLRLREWGEQTQTICLLCNNSGESTDHLCFNCPYTRTILMAVSEHLSQSFWNLANTTIP